MRRIQSDLGRIQSDLRRIQLGLGRTQSDWGRIQLGLRVKFQSGRWTFSIMFQKSNGGIEKGQWGHWKNQAGVLCRVNGGHWGHGERVNGGIEKGQWGIGQGQCRHWSGSVGVLKRVNGGWSGSMDQWRHWSGSMGCIEKGQWVLVRVNGVLNNGGSMGVLTRINGGIGQVE